MKLEYEFGTVLKLAHWAEELDDSIDFIDYWYNLALSKTKWLIESDMANRINAFHWTRWKEDFEQFEEKYDPKYGNGYSGAERSYFAMYSQYLVYSLQLYSKELAEYYGKSGFQKLMDCYNQYHCIGSNLFADKFAEKFGLPAGVEKIVYINL